MGESGPRANEAADRSLEAGAKENVEQQPPLLTAIVISDRFDYTVSGVIMLNAIFIGVSTHIDMQQAIDGVDEKDLSLKIVDAFFWAFYLVELCVRLMVFKLAFFCAAGVGWNYLDFILVLSSSAEMIIGWASEGDGGSNIGFFRVIRLLKVMKMLRLVRVMRFFRPLRLMLHQLVGSCETFFWTLVMLFLIMYVFGVGLVMGMGEYIKKMTPDERSGVEGELAIQFWGGLFTGMLSLLEAITGGNDWATIAAPLKEAGLHWYGFFVIYILFLLLAVLNVLTGIFVDAAAAIAQQDEAYVTQQQHSKKRVALEHLAAVFEKIDTDHNGILSWAEFSDAMKSEEGESLAELLEIDLQEAEHFFKMLSAGTGVVKTADFLEGCTRLRSAAKNADLIAVLNLAQNLTQKVDITSLLMMQQLTSLCKSTGTANGDVHEKMRELYGKAGLKTTLFDELGTPRAGSKLGTARSSPRSGENLQDQDQHQVPQAKLATDMRGALNGDLPGLAREVAEYVTRDVSRKLVAPQPVITEHLAQDIVAVLVPEVVRGLQGVITQQTLIPHNFAQDVVASLAPEVIKGLEARVNVLITGNSNGVSMDTQIPRRPMPYSMLGEGVSAVALPPHTISPNSGGGQSVWSTGARTSASALGGQVDDAEASQAFDDWHRTAFFDRSLYEMRFVGSRETP